LFYKHNLVESGEQLKAERMAVRPYMLLRNQPETETDRIYSKSL